MVSRLAVAQIPSSHSHPFSFCHPQTLTTGLGFKPGLSTSDTMDSLASFFSFTLYFCGGRNLYHTK